MTLHSVQLIGNSGRGSWVQAVLEFFKQLPCPGSTPSRIFLFETVCLICSDLMNFLLSNWSKTAKILTGVHWSVSVIDFCTCSYRSMSVLYVWMVVVCLKVLQRFALCIFLFPVCYHLINLSKISVARQTVTVTVIIPKQPNVVDSSRTVISLP